MLRTVEADEYRHRQPGKQLSATTHAHSNTHIHARMDACMHASIDACMHACMHVCASAQAMQSYTEQHQSARASPQSHPLRTRCSAGCLWRALARAASFPSSILLGTRISRSMHLRAVPPARPLTCATPPVHPLLSSPLPLAFLRSARHRPPPYLLRGESTSISAAARPPPWPHQMHTRPYVTKTARPHDARRARCAPAISEQKRKKERTNLRHDLGFPAACSWRAARTRTARWQR